MTKHTYSSSSEFTSSGHPDRVADNIAAAIINAIQQHDGPASHAAIEVFLTHDSAIIAGEATTTLDIHSPAFLKRMVETGFKRAGYYPEARKYWSTQELALPWDTEFKIIDKIEAQSPDIALGTTDKGEESGWNDQGVYYSSADNTNATRQGMPHFLATQIGEALQNASKDSVLNAPIKYCGESLVLGPDIKVVVTCETDADGFRPNKVTAVTVAQSHSGDTQIGALRLFVRKLVNQTCAANGIEIAEGCQWTINGTGRFVVHGCISDTSMTGRKISVNHPSAGPVWCNKMIGGGSLVKPWHASDLLLNVASRFIANVIVKSGLSNYAVVGCAGAIGVKGLQSIFIKGDEEFEKSDARELAYKFFEKEIDWSPLGLARLFGMFDAKFDFGKAVNDNFFGHPDTQPWENDESIQPLAKKLATQSCALA